MDVAGIFVGRAPSLLHKICTGFDKTTTTTVIGVFVHPQTLQIQDIRKNMVGAVRVVGTVDVCTDGVLVLVAFTCETSCMHRFMLG